MTTTAKANRQQNCSNTTQNNPDDLLIDCWQSSGRCHQLVARSPKNNEFRRIPVSSPKRALEIAIREANYGNDVYFAPAEFETPESRKAENVTGACCLWLDIDVGEEKAEKGGGYPTVEEALNALAFFFVAVGIPEPTHVVLSGTGLHVYWVLERQIGRELWLNLARKLKNLARVLQFLADPCRTADIASLMRVPGTLNHKSSPPLPVEPLHSSDDRIPVARMADAITQAHDRLVGAAPAPSRNRDHQCEDFLLNVLKSALACLDPDMEYPDWFRVVTVLFNETNGNDSAYELFDGWSSRGKKYRGREETLRKWNSINPGHPHPARMGSLRMMVEDAGYDWQRDVIEVAERALDAAKEAEDDGE